MTSGASPYRTLGIRRVYSRSVPFLLSVFSRTAQVTHFCRQANSAYLAVAAVTGPLTRGSVPAGPPAGHGAGAESPVLDRQRQPQGHAQGTFRSRDKTMIF